MVDELTKVSGWPVICPELLSVKPLGRPEPFARLKFTGTAPPLTVNVWLYPGSWSVQLASVSYGTAGAVTISSENVSVDVGDPEPDSALLAVIVIEKSPETVGVPVMAPPEVSRLSPRELSGVPPPVWAKVTFGVPPVDSTASLYVPPTVPVRNDE